MSASQPLPKDHPMVLAWEEHKKTDEYANAERWALVKEHIAGSLWSAFVAGYEAGSRSTVPAAAVPAGTCPECGCPDFGFHVSGCPRLILAKTTGGH